MKLIQDILKDSGHTWVAINGYKVGYTVFGCDNEVVWFPHIGVIVNSAGQLTYTKANGTLISYKPIKEKWRDVEEWKEFSGEARDVMHICYKEYLANLIERENNV